MDSIDILRVRLDKEGYGLAVQGVSVYNWYTSDQYGRDYVEMVNERAVEWKDDTNFQKLCGALPNDPVALALLYFERIFHLSHPFGLGSFFGNNPHLS